jgi:hypothetical protein
VSLPNCEGAEDAGKEFLIKRFSDLYELGGREKNHRPPFDQAQDERLST